MGEWASNTAEQQSRYSGTSKREEYTVISAASILRGCAPLLVPGTRAAGLATESAERFLCARSSPFVGFD
jgi:hypothetical protein